MRPFLGSLVLLLAVASLSGQQPGKEDDRWPPTQLKLHARQAPSPRLKFPLITPAGEQVKGNAAVSYHRAILLRREAITDQKQHNEEQNKLHEMLAEKPTEELQQRLKNHTARFKNALRELEYASLRDHCDWDLLSRIEDQGISTLIPEIQWMRELATLLKFRCRSHILDKNVPAALNDIRIGFTMARHVGEGPSLIQALVGIALFSIFAGELELALQLPDAPNLYWSLTALPPQFIQMRKAMEGELRGAVGTLPMWKDIDKGVMTPEAAKKALKTFSKTYDLLGNQFGLPGPDTKDELLVASFVALRHPSARKALLAMGYPPADVEAMPAAQAVILEGKLQFQSLEEEMYVYFDRPFLEADEGLTKVGERVKKIVSEGGHIDVFGASLVDLLVPAVHKVHEASGRVTRRVAALRVAEAIRLHAAENRGELPRTLAEIKSVPVPDDPVTGKPFLYVLDGQTARLNSTVRAPNPPLRYVIEIVK